MLVDFQGNQDAKQTLAKTLNLPVTVFISSNEPFIFEYFYPEKSMPLCLHGTLAGAALLFQKFPDQQQLNVQTKDGLALELMHADAQIQIKVSAQAAPEIHLNSDEIAKLINSSAFDLLYPLTVASVGSPKLLVPITSKTLLKNLQPNFELIKTWSQANKINGLYVYTVDTHNPDNNFYARAFNPITGHNEDIATGVAAAALALALKQNIIVEQGLMLGHPSEIKVTYHPQHLYVGGRVRI